MRVRAGTPAKRCWCAANSGPGLRTMKCLKWKFPADPGPGVGHGGDGQALLDVLPDPLGGVAATRADVDAVRDLLCPHGVGRVLQHSLDRLLDGGGTPLVRGDTDGGTR